MSNADNQSVRLAIAAMLRRCADYLSGLPAGDVDSILSGDLELRLSIVGKKRKFKKSPRTNFSTERLAEIESKLRAIESRDTGEAFLREIAPTRVALETIARHLDITARKDDRAEDLSRRIVDSIIGFRLSSAAIEGSSLGRRDEKNAKPPSSQK